MLVIRNAQMSAFRRAALTNYMAWVKYRLRTTFDEEVAPMSDEELAEFIWAATDEANRMGIELQPDAARFVEYAACFGPEFARTNALPGAAEILNQSDVDGTSKIEMLDRLDGAPVRF